ncbi:uncharacterized protein NFIA_077140 [Aspergillus fischeri NRRL 181]|uniref:Uncharacterized protein n=1 Tax=Neosartorya fischeri (strain ATCC 1020 / DSM 3700 / CBS 544.65 / FGSC A1164 / JCM 1740 / NRRL 181 / WB 181) TaxID=331117 RepID=A1DEH4_NEOFI|nr:uncharacterized protein NFIA_077140 [Aspergillus fischeri NRRL 181]EAW17781.1 hypothetical protein NFIA_077140 [Aspergillus fischeri NRRL 181]KAG2012632.1 hypothetical protein GB937_006981 [Aspergillus fischeri]
MHPFIITTSLDKPDRQTRKLIRSHVMRGKNTCKIRRAREAESPAAAAVPPSERWSSASGKEWVLTTPRKVASELSLFNYMTEMKPYMFSLLFQALTVIKPAMHALETVTDHSHSDKMLCFADISQYPAMVHSIMFTAQAFHDMSLGASYGLLARFHLAKTLQYLQQSLENRAEATKSSTMTVVGLLSLAGIIAGDLESAAKHMDGLHRMVELRGGWDSLADRETIEHKAKTIDLYLAAGTGSKLRFVEDISWGPHLAHGRLATRFPELKMVSPRPDTRLLNVWADIREFSTLANKATTTGVKLAVTSFLQFSRSAPYRLLSLQCAHPFHELLRLSMLAFLKPLLIQIPGIGRQMTYLAEKLKASLLEQTSPPLVEQASLLLWSLFVTCLSIFEEQDQEWLRALVVQTVHTLGLRTWADTRAVLKSFLWVDLMLDQAGERVFERCVYKTPVVSCTD